MGAVNVTFKKKDKYYIQIWNDKKVIGGINSSTGVWKLSFSPLNISSISMYMNDDSDTNTVILRAELYIRNQYRELGKALGLDKETQKEKTRDKYLKHFGQKWGITDTLYPNQYMPKYITDLRFKTKDAAMTVMYMWSIYESHCQGTPKQAGFYSILKKLPENI